MGQTESSFREAARRIRAFQRRFAGSAGQAARIVGEEIMTDVKASRPGHGVPVDTGVLRSTGRVEGPGRAERVVLSFGGAAAPYALVQHERLDLHHEVGEARYLVRGLERWRPGGSAALKALEDMAEEAVRRARR